VEAIRHVESALGNGIKTPAPCEIPNMRVARKSVIAARPLANGHTIVAEDLGVKRPGNGLAPKLLPSLVGRTLRKDVGQDELITWDHLA